VVLLAIENQIDVVFTRWDGDPLARLWHPGQGSTAGIRRAQLLAAADTAEAVFLVRSWAVEKVGAQAIFLRTLAKARRRDSRKILKAAEAVEALRDELLEIDGQMCELRPVLMGYEGRASRYYFQGLAEVMPPAFRFQGRSRRPAKDPFNACLNYGYGMLYSKVERCLLLAGLDPYLGFLHTDRYNKPSLVYDFIEPFRDWVDRPVTRLFTGKLVNKGQFRNEAGQITLEREAKAALIDAVNQFLAGKEVYRKRKQRRERILQARAHDLAQCLLKGTLGQGREGDRDDESGESSGDDVEVL
jgi:CRISPR-associated protein Cas1